MFEYISLGVSLLLNLILLGYHFLYVKEASKERKDLIKAILARDLPEFDSSIRAEKEKPSSMVSEEPEFVSMEEAIENDRIFKKMLENQVGEE